MRHNDILDLGTLALLLLLLLLQRGGCGVAPRRSVLAVADFVLDGPEGE